MSKATARRFVRPLLAAVLALLLVGSLAPFMNAARFSGRIKRALESSLGRQVTFEKAYFTLFSGPGFSLENVTISEDPRYGIEPFAYVPTLRARLRLDKLLAGDIRFSGLRLVDPALNLVKRADGTWNVVELVQRMSAPRRGPLSRFPAFEVSDGRVDFKLGSRKTTLYISESDLSIYPERSGKIRIRFSGSPARTDRAGMGFGHFRGTVNWFLSSNASNQNRLEAELFLDPSNLSELTTLVEGHDAGIHGTISSHLWLEGPATDLNVAGSLRLNDVHRWDLLPASGEEWTVRYGGNVDLLTHRIDLRTAVPRGGPSPMAVHLLVKSFLSGASSSVMAELKDASLVDLLPLATRMGVALPNGAALHGAVNGAIGYSNEGGWSGGLDIANAEASLRGAPILRASAANVTVLGDHVHLDPATIEASRGALQMSGDYYFGNQHGNASLNASEVSLDEFKALANSWFGDLGPLSAMNGGVVSGQFSYLYGHSATGPSAGSAPASWSGQFSVFDAAIKLPGLAIPLESVRARVGFRDASFELDHLTGNIGGQSLRASYSYNALARNAERARIELPSTDLSQLQGAISSANESGNFWTRLRLGRRLLPAWLSKRNLEGELVVGHLFAEGQQLGAFNSHFSWKGARLAFSDAVLKLVQGQVRARGTVDLASYDPRWNFSATASNYPWSGGSLDAEGDFSTVGTGQDVIRNLTAAGSFTGRNLALSRADLFENVAGLFRFSFDEGWPDLRLSEIQATQNGDRWSGEGSTQSDGKLLLTLGHEGRQVHFVSSLAGGNGQAPLSAVPDSRQPSIALRQARKF